MTARFHTLFILAAGLLILALLTAAGCTLAGGKAENKMISRLETKSEAVFPLTNTQITCTAADPDGTALTYQWTCTQGTIEGSGPQVTWIAPNQLGWFPIMVTVQNSKGQSEQETIQVAVVEKNSATCPTCPARNK
jgi:hypothetical protein